MKTMKKYFFMAVAAIAALSSCTSDNELEMNQNTDKETLTFTATMENSEATRATYNSTDKCAAWEVGDQISINGKTYSAQEAGTTSTFKADGEGATGSTYNAYFPADLYDGTNATLPAIQTYTAGKFNMPMYATSTTTELAFKNLCAVLAIKVTSADITTLKSIKVASDKKMNGKFTVDENNKAVINDDKGTNVVVLESATAITLDETGTTFYIAIPAQEYKFLNIFLSADGLTYTQAMATKKAAGIGSIARNTIYSIDYTKNATKLWEGKLFFADCNIGAKTETEICSNYLGVNVVVANEWGANWRMPTKDELTTLKGLGEWDKTKVGLQCTGKDTYASNSIFLPSDAIYTEYLSSTPFNEQSVYILYLNAKEETASVDYRASDHESSVRAVLEEEASPVRSTTGKATRTGNIEVNWVQLWENGPKFAEYNVGATSSVTEFGGYYCWGKSTDKDKNGNHMGGSDFFLLTGTDDTATNLWGNNWRMPTNVELGALLENCTCTWTTNYNGTDVNGLLCTGKEGTPYASNSIFLPAAGYWDKDKGVLTSPNRYWSSKKTDSNTAKCLQFSFFRDNLSTSVKEDGHCYCGFSVRAVLNENAE